MLYKAGQLSSTPLAPSGPVMTNTSREILRGGLISKDGEDSWAAERRTHQ